MTSSTAVGTFINILFTIAVWFAIPVVMPVVAALAWVLIVCNFLLSLGIFVTIVQAYSE